MKALPGMADPGLGLANIEAYRGRKDPQAIKAVAKEMEAMFAYELIKVMRESSGASSKGGLGSDTYMSMFDMELSRLFAERGLGLEQMLEQGMSGASGTEKEGQAAPAAAPEIALPAEPQAGTDLRTEIKSVLPDIDHARISSAYGLRTDPFTGKQKFHHGVDIPAPEGTPVHAIRGGTVAFSGEQRGYGNVVIIDHGDGYMTRYAHNSENLVRQGDAVVAGTEIAASGSTGRSTGPHVHFEVLYRGRDVRPDTLPAAG